MKPVVRADSEVEVSATADDAGRYSLAGLSPGTYTLRGESALLDASSTTARTA